MLMAGKDFTGQADDEVVKMVLHRHWSVLLKPLFLSLVIIIGVITLLCLWPKYQWLWYVAVVAVILAIWSAFHAWIRWYYSVYIVTNRRIKQQIQRSLFRKTSIDVYLDKVQTISYNISGLRGSLSGYGMLVLHTMAGDMVMTKIANCEEVYSRLSEIVRQAGGNLEQGNNNE